MIGISCVTTEFSEKVILIIFWKKKVRPFVVQKWCYSPLSIKGFDGHRGVGINHRLLFSAPICLLGTSPVPPPHGRRTKPVVGERGEGEDQQRVEIGSMRRGSFFGTF